MELLRNQAAYERNKKQRNAKTYTFVRKQMIGKVERNVFAKHQNVEGVMKKVEYVKHNGKYMQLKRYKDMMKQKNLYKSPSSSPAGKKCKKDCEAIKKICNKATGRCNNLKKTSKKSKK
jgi:hypothetical protein